MQEQQEMILHELDDVDEEYVDDDAGESTQEDAPPAQGDDQVILCGLYWDSNKRLDLPEELVKLLEYAQGKGIPVLICGDFKGPFRLPYKTVRYQPSDKKYADIFPFLSKIY